MSCHVCGGHTDTCVSQPKSGLLERLPASLSFARSSHGRGGGGAGDGGGNHWHRGSLTGRSRRWDPLCRICFFLRPRRKDGRCAVQGNSAKKVHVQSAQFTNGRLQASFSFNRFAYASHRSPVTVTSSHIFLLLHRLDSRIFGVAAFCPPQQTHPQVSGLRLKGLVDETIRLRFAVCEKRRHRSLHFLLRFTYVYLGAYVQDVSDAGPRSHFPSISLGRKVNPLAANCCRPPCRAPKTWFSTEELASVDTLARGSALGRATGMRL